MTPAAPRDLIAEGERILATAQSLHWRVKDSLRSYVQRNGGSVQIVQPAAVAEDAFRFPKAQGEARFAGGVFFAAHGGLMNVLIAEPSIRRTAAGFALFIADPADPRSEDLQWEFASLVPVKGTDGNLAMIPYITARAAEFLGGAYPAGTELDLLTWEV